MTIILETQHNVLATIKQQAQLVYVGTKHWVWFTSHQTPSTTPPHTDCADHLESVWSILAALYGKEREQRGFQISRPLNGLQEPSQFRIAGGKYNGDWGRGSSVRSPLQIFCKR